MKKHFYNHIVNIESITISLNELNLSADEKKHLHKLIEQNVHYAVIDTVLSELTPSDKKIFLIHLHADNHTKIWELLRSRNQYIEDKIKQTIEKLLETMHYDIHELQKT